MTEKRELYVRLIHQGVSNSAACRSLGIDRKTGHWWKNGGVVVRNGVSRIVAPLVVQALPKADSGRYLSEDERVTIADGDRAGRSARSIAAELGRAVSTISRELKRNAPADGGGSYLPHAAHATMLARRPRPRPRRLEVDVELRQVVQGYLDQRWSPEQTARAVRVDHGVSIVAETIYQALYSPQRVLQRDPRVTLRTRRPHRRPRRRGDERRARFVVPMKMIEDRPDDADHRNVAGHWEGDLIIGAFNRSAIGTLVERSTRFTILVHLGEGSRAHNLRDQLTEIFNQLPAGLRRSLTWDQGVEMCHHHEIADATGMPVFFCHRGSPWQRPTNENTNGLLRDYFPKGTNLRVHTAADLARVSDELNRRPRKVLDWQTPQDLFTTLQTLSV
jgi:IS30 family transposase